MNPTHAEALGREVLECCRALGFALAGITDAAPPEGADRLAEWLRAGRHGTMAWMQERLDERRDPAALLAGARSIIVVADQYAPRGGWPAAERPGEPTGRVAAYAGGRDYHRLIKARLRRLADALHARHPAARFRAFSDTAPVMERDLAVRAGIGWKGRHTLLIHPEFGSFLVLGGIITTLHLCAAGGRPGADHCGTCRRCIDACPTAAISDEGVDARACISYLTIEHKGAIDPTLQQRMGEWAFGCDVCQDACPFNHPAGGRGGGGQRVRSAYAPRAPGLPLLEVLGWNEEDRRRAFVASAMKRASLDMLKRNALVALGNRARRTGDFSLLAHVERAAADPAQPELVRVTAAQVLRWARPAGDDQPPYPSTCARSA